MSRPLIVLKFGGSVLASPDRLSLAVHETYRRVRAGYSVAAVVSAFGGRTDELAARAASFGDPSASASAALLGLGETESAALLTLALNEAGIRAEVLDEVAIGLRASGQPLDADPTDVDVDAMREALGESDVIVVPGFVARDRRGRRVLLGRGGSDLTALFLAERLNAARCRLIKDVDGLFEWDPARAGPRPRKYATIDWAGALRLDGSILQHKAIRFAKTARHAFEVASFNSRTPTRVGPFQTRYVEARPPRRPLRVALLGAGTVGLGVLRRLEQIPSLFEVVSVAVRDIPAAAARGVSPWLLTSRVPGPETPSAAVVVECIGGITPAREAILKALRAGIDVVSANKAVVAACSDEFERAARAGGASLRFSAAVGGAAPILEAVTRAARDAGVRSVRAVLNGTSSFVLSRVADGASLADAVSEAQQRGLAEADPSRDLDGRDAADKLCLIARAATGTALSPNDLPRDEINAATQLGGRTAQVAELDLSDSQPRAVVRLIELANGDPLARLRRGECGAVIESRAGTRSFVAGTGAGRWPTAEAVLADLLELSREVDSAAAPETDESSLARPVEAA